MLENTNFVTLQRGFGAMLIAYPLGYNSVFNDTREINVG